MSRFIEVSELPVVASDNGLQVESDPYFPSARFLRRQSGGPRASVAFGQNGLVDLSESFRRVLYVCYGHGGHARGR